MSKPQCMTSSVDRRKSTDAHDAMTDLKEVKINSRDHNSALAVLKRANALFNKHKGTEERLVRNAQNALDQAASLATRVAAEGVALKHRRARALRDFDHLTAVRDTSPKPGEQTVALPTTWRKDAVKFFNKRPLSRSLCQSAIGQRILRPPSPKRPPSPQRPRSPEAAQADAAFGAHQRVEWNQMRNSEWRPHTPSVLGQLQADPNGHMCLARQLERFKSSDKMQESRSAEVLHTETEGLCGEEPEVAGRPLVQNWSKYKQVAKDILTRNELSARPKTVAEGAVRSHLRSGVVQDCKGRTAVKVHNAWITRFNSKPQIPPMR